MASGKMALKKLMPLLIDVTRSDPQYMPQYMRVRRRFEKVEPHLMLELSRDAEKLLDRLEKML